MEEQKSCADCLNLGRSIYRMQCVRVNKEHKDMFRSSAPLSVPYQPSENNIKATQPEKNEPVHLFCFIRIAEGRKYYAKDLHSLHGRA